MKAMILKYCVLVSLLFSPVLVLAQVDSREIARYSALIPVIVLVIWILKSLFFKNKKMGLGIPIVVLVVFVIGVAAAMYHGNKDPMLAKMKSVVSEVNAMSPTMVDQETRLDGAMYKAPILTISYTLVNIEPDELTPQELVDQIYLVVKEQTCSKNELLLALDKGIEINYSYADKHGNHITVIDFNKLSCG